MKIGQEYDGMKADIYSLGILLLYLVTGRFPSDFLNPSSDFGFNFPHSISPPLVDLLLGLLSPIPLHRFSCEEVFQCEWIYLHKGTQGKTLNDSVEVSSFQSSDYTGEVLNDD